MSEAARTSDVPSAADDHVKHLPDHFRCSGTTSRWVLCTTDRFEHLVSLASSGGLSPSPVLRLSVSWNACRAASAPIGKTREQ